MARVSGTGHGTPLGTSGRRRRARLAFLCERSRGAARSRPRRTWANATRQTYPARANKAPGPGGRKGAGRQPDLDGTSMRKRPPPGAAARPEGVDVQGLGGGRPRALPPTSRRTRPGHGPAALREGENEEGFFEAQS